MSDFFWNRKPIDFYGQFAHLKKDSGDPNQFVKKALGPVYDQVTEQDKLYDAEFGDDMTIKVNKERAAPYVELFKKTAEETKIPEEFLLRQAMTESSFLPEIVSGKKKSSAGAVGIMQIVPKWHPNVDPTNPKEAIPYAAKYVNKLKDAFGGDWRKAFAAYNWGPGNLRKLINKKGEDWEQHLPKETADYLEKILGRTESMDVFEGDDGKFYKEENGRLIEVQDA